MLVDVLTPDRILIRPIASDKWAVISILANVVERAWAAHGIQAGLVAELALQRERDLSTGFESGLAVPHAFVALDVPTTAALAILESGIEFGCLDGQPARFILLLAACGNAEGRRRHLALLGHAAATFGCPQRAARLEAAADAAAAWTALID